MSYLSQASHTLHWGLGSATRIDRLEVRWHAGVTNILPDLEANACYEIVEGASEARRLHVGNPRSSRPSGPTETNAIAAAAGVPGVASAATEEKQCVRQFWNTQRAAMDAMKVERDHLKAIRLFREAIALNPQHEDSRYYLGLCLASQGDTEGALAALEGLQ